MWWCWPRRAPWRERALRRWQTAGLRVIVQRRRRPRWGDRRARVLTALAREVVATRRSAEVRQAAAVEAVRMELCCAVCFEAARQVIFECGHVVCCATCAAPLAACPICRRALVRPFARAILV